MLWAFGLAGALRVLSALAPGVLWEWHPFTWLRAAGVRPGLVLAAESWGWFLEWTPAMVGSGMLVDVDVAASFVGGSVLAWWVPPLRCSGVLRMLSGCAPACACACACAWLTTPRALVGPYIVRRGLAFGAAASEDPYWAGLVSYSSLAGGSASPDRPSPRYWLLWPGVALMLAVSMTGLLCQWYSILRSHAPALVHRFRAMWRRESYTALPDNPGSGSGSDPRDHIPPRMWAPGLVVVVAAAVLSMKLTLGVSPPQTLLALGLAFLLSLVAIQATGATDTTPLTAVSTVSQMVLGGTHAASVAEVALRQRLNLLGGALANMGAGQACDLMGDFRVGFLLRTPPRAQYAAQLLGTLAAAVAAPVLFALFATAYPCI
ncbi:hypothetical protein E4U42_002061, partial [Claviceps africana]